jgi:hypothetical protein
MPGPPSDAKPAGRRAGTLARHAARRPACTPPQAQRPGHPPRGVMSAAMERPSMVPSLVRGRPGGPAATRTSTATQGDRHEQVSPGTHRTRRQAPRGGDRWPGLHGRQPQARAAGARPESQGRRRRRRLVRLGRHRHRVRPERSGLRVAGTRDRSPGSSRHPRAARFGGHRTLRGRALGQRAFRAELALRAEPLRRVRERARLERPYRASHAHPCWQAPATQAAPAIPHRRPPSPTPPAPVRSACATCARCARLAAVSAPPVGTARPANQANAHSNSHSRSTR